ncbi:MAG: Farnesyl diphosphate synthase [Alphaproteobacteria bacterium MarineAlpha6_Bin4]|nr:MAG: Farnesyl diphosphate synthase [Alphaproteobacteria bacterium MarineAlpha6_Bin3]PPR37893.1 MAG: Farnesyl diphosphate synthase [Alphaproteobacteria bacterium MarineAlpha6_Bin4]|tara:strand:- start:11433 stop:12320 length:888 start_codon:yes stop_codon:yes gene_type:complete
MNDLKANLRSAQKEVDKTIKSLLPFGKGIEKKLFEAINYSILSSGKRLRPFLVIQSSKLFDVSEKSALRVASSIEMIHSYSLIHDDLPSMDNDDLRRGLLTTHKKYNEATAILAGDSLLTLSFQVLSDTLTHSDPRIRCDLINELAKAAGAYGMVGGQMMDLEAENKKLSIGAITRIQMLKTGALIAYACNSGAIMGRAEKKEKFSLQGYAHDIGLAYQIRDDLLDVTSTEKELGKKVNKDKKAGKKNFVSILGKERAKKQLEFLGNQAIKHLEVFDDKANLLREVARFIVERDR